jgi:hypothetical protein
MDGFEHLPFAPELVGQARRRHEQLAVFFAKFNISFLKYFI